MSITTPMSGAQHLDQRLLHEIVRHRPVRDPEIDDQPDRRKQRRNISLPIFPAVGRDRLSYRSKGLSVGGYRPGHSPADRFDRESSPDAGVRLR